MESGSETAADLDTRSPREIRRSGSNADASAVDIGDQAERLTTAWQKRELNVTMKTSYGSI
jgi:hypothetical protein